MNSYTPGQTNSPVKEDAVISGRRTLKINSDFKVALTSEHNFVSLENM